MELEQQSEKKVSNISILVILGGGFDISGNLREWSQMRSLAAAAIIQRNNPDCNIIIPSSGYTLGINHFSEAQSISWLIGEYADLDNKRLLNEDVSYSTSSNAHEVYKIINTLAAENTKLKNVTIYILTSAYHIKRSLLLFRRHVYEITPQLNVELQAISAEEVLVNYKDARIEEKYKELNEMIQKNRWIKIRQTLFEYATFLISLPNSGELLLDSIAKYRLKTRKGIVKLHF